MIANARPYPLFAALVIFFMTGVVAAASPDDWALASATVNSIRAPRIPERDFSIIHQGAVSGGKTDARPAILAAIEQAHAKGGGRVVIPKGVWLCKGPIHLKSSIELYVAKGATLLFSADPADYLPAVPTRRDGIELQGYSPLIYGYKVQDVAIRGPGTIDGNSESEFHKWTARQEPDLERLRRQDAAGAPAEQRVYGAGAFLRPAMIQFIHSERVLLENFTLNHAPLRALHLAYTDHSILRNTRIDSRQPGNAGIELESSTYALIESNSLRTAEAALSIASQRDRHGKQIRRPSAYIVVRNNDLGGGKGIVLASEMSGGIRNVFFSDNILREGLYAMLFEADMDRGGTVEHIRVRNLTVESSSEHLFRFRFNLDVPYEGHPPSYSDLVFENISAGRVGTVLEARAPPQAPLRNVLLKNLTVKQSDRNFALENVEELKLENVQLGTQAVSGRLDWKEAVPLPPSREAR